MERNIKERGSDRDRETEEKKERNIKERGKDREREREEKIRKKMRKTMNLEMV